MFTDLIVIDASSVLAGPSVGTFFAELGAKVIKVEHPKHSDVTRSWKLSTERKDAVSAYFSSVNFKKNYIELDLKDTEDHVRFIDLIRTADILLTNFKYGDDKKLHIEDDELLALNPKLLIGKINGYGSESDRVAYDLILQAESGIMSMNGTPESGPVKMPVAFIDVLAAHHLKEALLIGLYERTSSNKGNVYSVSLYDTAISSLTNQASNYLMADHVAERIGSLHPNIAPYGELFETKDKQLITLAIGSDVHFAKLCIVLGLQNLVQNPNYISNQLRVLNRTELAMKIKSKIEEFNCDQLLNKLIDLNIPAGKIKDLEEVFNEQSAKDLIREEIINDTLTKRITSIVYKRG